MSRIENNKMRDYRNNVGKYPVWGLRMLTIFVILSLGAMLIIGISTEKRREHKEIQITIKRK